MITKAIIIGFMLFIVFYLGSGLYYLVKDKSQSERVVKALGLRIGLSLALFVLLMVGFAMGWITPHGL